MNTVHVALPADTPGRKRRPTCRQIGRELAAFEESKERPIRMRKVTYTKGGKMIVAALLLLAGCGIKDTVTSSLSMTGELKLVNNTSVDATVQQQGCGADFWDWQELGIIRAGKSKTWTHGEQCYSLRAINEYGESWTGTAIVQGGMRVTLWIVWR